MTKYFAAFAILLSAFFFSISTNNAGEDKFEPKCPVAGKAIKKNGFTEHNGGKVFFCCGMCKGAFEETPGKFAAKANHQLVGTGQAKQVKCPFTGGKLNPDTKIEVYDVAVCFCCNNCKGKAEDLQGAAKVNAIFSDKAFKKGFKVKASE